MKKIISIALIISLLLSGCGLLQEQEEPETPSPTETTATPEPTYTPRMDGKLNLMMRKPLTLNPVLNEDVTVDRILKLMFEPLFTYDEALKPTPNIAEGFELSPDGKSVIVELKKNIFWDDGVRITSDDLIYTLEAIDDAPDGSVYKNVTSNIIDYDKLDSSMVRIEFGTASYKELYSLCFPVIPKHYYEGEDDPESTRNMLPVGNGAYKIETLDEVKIMTLVKNSGYFKGDPQIDRVDVIISPYSDTEISAFEQRIIDVVPAGLSDWGKYRGSNETSINDYMSMYFDFIGVNYENPLFKSSNIRKAIAHSINVDEMVTSIYLGHAVKAETPLNPNAWFYDSTMGGYEFSLEKAKLLIGMEGFLDWDNDGIIDKQIDDTRESFSFTILINEENAEREKVAAIVKDNLAKLGMECTIESLPFEEYEARIKARDYDMFLGGFNLSVKPELDFAFMSTKSMGGTNYFDYRDEALDGYLIAVSSAASESAYKKALNDLQAHMKDELPCIGLVFRKSALLTDKKISGSIRPGISNLFGNIYQWRMADDATSKSGSAAFLP